MRKKNIIIIYSMGYICIAIALYCFFVISPKMEETKRILQEAQQAEKFKLSEEICEPLLQSGKSYESMNHDEKASICYVIDNWDNYEQSFKYTYQSQKDLLKESIKKQDERIRQAQQGERIKQSQQDNDNDYNNDMSNAIAEYNYTHSDIWHK